MTVEFHQESLQNALKVKEESFHAAESDTTAQEDKQDQENFAELVSHQDQISMEMIEEKEVDSAFAIKPENLSEQQSILTTEQFSEQISTTEQAFTTDQVNTTTDQADMKVDQDNMITDQADMNSVQTQDQNSYQQTQEDNSIKQDISEGITMDMVQEPSHQEGISMEMVEPAPETIDPILLKEQLKWFSATMRTLKKRADARFFLVPVDPVALAIPTYFTIVKEPMDISTIEQKISHGRYQKIDEAIYDFRLIFQNCYAFNGEAAVFSIAGKACEAWFDKEMIKMPKTMDDVYAKQKKIPKLDINGFGSKISTHDSGKRRLTSGRVSSDLKFCAYIYKELMKKVNHGIVWAFKDPVDPVALNIPTYFSIIKHPMDLLTIKKKMDAGEYETADDFESDARLIISNCFTFNAPGSAVHDLGVQFEAFFDLKWSEKTNYLNQHADAFVSGTRQKSFSYSDSDDYDDDEESKHISMLKTQLNLLNQQLKMLQDKQARKRDKRRASRLNSAGIPPVSTGLPYVKPAKKNSIPGNGAKRGRKKRVHESDDEKMPETDITYEQKRELSDSINILPADKLPQVFEIIKENANLNAVEDEEIELDIDSLDKPVLWKLYLFVKKHTRPPKKAKIDDQGDATIVGPVSSSSESEDGGDSDVPKPGLRKAKIALLAGPSKPTFRKSKTSKSIPAAPVATKKPASTVPLPFRTEKGEVTNYVSNFKVAQKAPAVKQAKPAPPPKPAYDSFLDLAWERLDTIKSKPAEEAKPKSEPPKPAPAVQEKVKTSVRSPSPEVYEEPHEWLDLQGQSDLIKETADRLGDEDEMEELRRETYANAKIQLDALLAEDVLLNNEYPEESSEEGELN